MKNIRASRRTPQPADKPRKQDDPDRRARVRANEGRHRLLARSWRELDKIVSEEWGHA